MRNIITREGYEFWDKICAVQSYAFLLSPDSRRVVKTPDIGDWIDKHEAQVIVDHAQEDYNVMKDELARLRERHDTVKCQRNEAQQRLAAAEQRNSELVELLTEHQWDWEQYDSHSHREGGYYCVECQEPKASGHEAGCKLAAALKPTES